MMSEKGHKLLKRDFMLGLAIGAGVQALGSLAGGLVTRARKKKRQRALDKEQNTLDEWYSKSQSQSYLDNENAKATLALLHRQNKQAVEHINNNLIRNGATAESKVATASALNRNYADTVSRLAVADSQRKERDRERYISLSQNVAARRGDNTSAPGNYITAATQSIGGTINNLWGNDALKIPRRNRSVPEI